MKTDKITVTHPNGKVKAFIVPTTAGGFKITFPDRPTIEEATEQVAWDYLRADGEIQFKLEENICMMVEETKENRHGVDGHRTVKYVGGHWDETYLFFRNLMEVVTAIQKNDFTEARNLF